MRHVRGNRAPEIQHLCRTCVQEGRMRAGGRTGPFDEFLAQFLGQAAPRGAGGSGRGPGDQGPAGPERAPRREQVDITRFFTDASRQLLQRAAEQAVAWGSLDLETEHLLAAALRDDVVRHVLDAMEVDPNGLAARLEEQAETAPRTDVAPSLSPDAKWTLLAAYEGSRRLGVDYIGPEHVLLALARDRESLAGRVLGAAGVSDDDVRAALARGVAAEHAATRAASDTPTIDRHSRDLTAGARDGKLDPVVGREDEIEQTIEVLSRRTKNNPVLVGEAGVGKTAIVEGIAQRIVEGEVPETLEGRRLVSLDLAGMLAGTRHRGEFEERMTSIVDEIERHQDELLLFIDEVHTLVGAGAAEGAMDAANILKAPLARGQLRAIGATTLDEYRKHIERDPALERRFSPITVRAPSVENTIDILYGLKDRYEAFHRVRITDDAIRAAAELSDRYVTDRFLPDKAVDLLDQAGARVRLRQPSKSSERQRIEADLRELEREKEQAVAGEEYERAGEVKERIAARRHELEELQDTRRRAGEVDAEDIAEVVSRSTGIPIAQLTLEERQRLLDLEERLHERVIDQDEAVVAVAEAVRRSRAGLGDQNRPVGSFLFLGPTGVGKTELARALADALFGDEDLMIRFDMSEFQERHTLSRLIGAPPGYVGHEQAGQLTERVRRQPYAVLLLDEIEKAHPDIFNSMLQVLDDGRLTDAQGRTVDFANTVVVMTSNLGSERIQASGAAIGFQPLPSGPEDEFTKIEEDLRGILRRNLRPEFLNRIDEIVVFRPLTEPQLREITQLLVDRVSRRMEARNIGVRFTDAAIERLAVEGFDPEFGARPLKRTIQRMVENELARQVIGGRIEEGDRVVVGERGGEITLDVEPGANGEDDVDDWEEREAPRSPATAGPAAPRR